MENRGNGSLGRNRYVRKAEKGELSLISVDYFDILHHCNAPNKEWAWSDTTPTKKCIPLAHIISVTQHSDRGILQKKIVGGKCKKYWKPLKKNGEEKKQLQLFHQNRTK